ncbi:hypothetical protein ONR57_16285 [Hoyosella sp. YIM 151337]|uniref:hypothetical protein n=1 Tax=Hoyosella sp. YIM 151337 TaxID=2992742 RepID=UPI0022363C05|nr:hypothetical protein [Hoyosella sp. YIM 151337]MCW4354864.1 hypothetical protein [Hoyosella sp. YIM 151337]
MAPLVGTAAVHASHVGPTTMFIPGLPKVPWRTSMLGETQIVERDGTILARLSEADGEGDIAATIAWERLHRPIRSRTSTGFLR